MPPILVPSSTKCIARWILVTAKLNKRYCKTLFQEVVFLIWSFPARNYLFNVSYWRTKTRYENCSKLRTKIQKWCQWHRSGVFVVNCEHISCSVLIAGLHSNDLLYICLFTAFAYWTWKTYSQLTFTCSKWTIETPEKDVKMFKTTRTASLTTFYS